jgi:hypothetical protein
LQGGPGGRGPLGRLFLRGIEQLLFVGGAHGALSFAASDAAFDVFEEGAGGPGVIFPGVLEAAFTLFDGDGGVIHGFGSGGQLGDCVGEHLL